MEEILSPLLAFITYTLHGYVKTIPFSYITQNDYAICHWMNDTFCSRISSFVAIICIYFAYLQAIQVLSLPTKNALADPPRNGFEGAYIGAGCAILSFALNNIFGFLDIKDINPLALLNIPIIMLGMIMTGVTEELLFRAIPINALLPYLSKDIIVIGTALLFGYVHASYSVYYAFSTCISGLLLGYGFVSHGFFWAAGFHTAYNTVETTAYTTCKYKVKNPFMAGERKTPDDDGITSSIVELVVFGMLKYVGYL